jgi:preprotein translocase subunit SecD
MAARMPEERWFSRWVSVASALLTLGLLACGGLGVEQYREAEPRGTLEVRRVATSGRADVEVLPRLDGAGDVSLEPGAILRSSHVAHVQLVDGADGVRLIVLQLRDEGRVRLREATAGEADRSLALVVDGRVVATPTVRGVLDQNEIAVRVAPAQIDAAYAALGE